MATNLAQILQRLAISPVRNQANSFPPRNASTVPRGFSPLGQAFLEGTTLAEQSLSRNIAPRTGEEGIPKSGPGAPSSPNESSPTGSQTPTDATGRGVTMDANLGDLAKGGLTVGSFLGGPLAAAFSAISLGNSLFGDPLGHALNNSVAAPSISDAQMAAWGLGPSVAADLSGITSLNDPAAGDFGPGTGTWGGFSFSTENLDTESVNPGGPISNEEAEEANGGPGNDNGSDSDDESGGACIISTALTAMGDWDRRKKLKAVRWCRDKHHDGSMRGAIWVDGYHCWGARFVHLMKKYPWFKRFGLRISTAYLNQITGEKKSVLGLITWAWVTPLSYIVGGIRKTCSAMASSRKS